MNRDNKKYWDKMAPFYNKMFDRRKAYLKIYDLINQRIDNSMSVLEIGTGSGLIARAISKNAKSIEATDFSSKMIEKAKDISHDSNVNFSVQDAGNLSHTDATFDVVIISNVLHVVPNPTQILQEIRRVLKNHGILIAPTFMWKELNLLGKIQKFFMLKKSFPAYSQWSSKEYIDLLKKGKFKITKKKIIKWSFNICYVECEKV